jgi:hypothetical protein
MKINPKMIKKMQKIYCKLVKIKNKDKDYSLSVINWIKKMKYELNSNSVKKVAELNFIPKKLVKKLNKISIIYLEYL